MPIGPATTTLRSVVAQLALMMRCAGIAYTIVQVVIWHSFYAAAAWRLVAPALAVAWAAAVSVSLLRRWPSPRLAIADSAVYAALALGAQGGVPPVVRDDAFSWLVISMAGQIVVAMWYSPGVLSMLLAFVAPAAYWTGVRLQPAADARTLAGATILLTILGLAHAYGRRELCARAAAADAALDAADHAASEQYAILSRNIERREHERLLHDTVLNTLTALARADGGAATAVNRCRQDVALVESALGAPGTRAAGAMAAAGDLRSELHAVAAPLRDRGLTVRLEADAGTAPAVPARVTTAIVNATREALSNVAAHAGTREAWVRVRMPASAADGGDVRDVRDAWRVEVVVRDRGVGFDPARVDGARLGIRRSIAERIAECGGQASVWSAPGLGTEVRISWPAPAPAPPGEPDPARRPRADRPPAVECPPW